MNKTMKLIDQVCSLEQAKKLKELGINQESTWYWQFDNYQKDEPCYLSLFRYGFEGDDFFKAGMGAHNGIDISDFSEEYYSAYTVAELGVMLSVAINSKTFKTDDYPRCDHRCDYRWYLPNKFKIWEHFDSEAIARAALLIHLIETAQITADEVNNRLATS